MNEKLRNKNMARNLLAFVVVTALLLTCRTSDVLNPVPTAQATERAKVARILPSTTPTLTPEPSATLFVPSRTATRHPSTPTVTRTRAPVPTFIPVPKFPFVRIGEMQVDPNCGTEYVKGSVFDKDGNPLNGQKVRMTFFDNSVFKVTGEGEDPGVYNFAPFSKDVLHTRIPAELSVVAGDGRTQLSEAVKLNFICDTAGQFTGVNFKAIGQ